MGKTRTGSGPGQPRIPGSRRSGRAWSPAPARVPGPCLSPIPASLR